MLEKNTPFIQQYINDAIHHLTTIANRELTQSEKDAVIKRAHEDYVDDDIVLKNSVKNVSSTLPLSKLVEMIVDKDAIITGYGTVYKNQHNFDSVICKLLTYFMDGRKVVKGEMIALLNAGVPKSDVRVKVLDQKQKILKLLANSFYGAYAEKSFIFYNPDQAPSVTYTGRLIIGYTLYLFETMLMDNHCFTDSDELLVYISSCLSVTNGLDLSDLGENPNVPDVVQMRKEVYEKFVSYCVPSDSSWNPEEVAKTAIDRVTDDQLTAFYFRGNIYRFFEFEAIAESIKDIIDGGVIEEADMKWLSKNYTEAHEFLDSLWGYIRDWVLAPGLVRNINHKIDNMHRKSVILTDTDSTFLTVDPWVNWCEDHLQIDSGKSEDTMLTVINMMLTVMRQASDYQMQVLTENMLVPEDYRWLINFKSEFIYSRLLLTNGKKHYMGLMTFQEGAKLVNENGELGEIEVKGLAIKKSNLSAFTGKYLSDLIETNIYRKGTEIDRFTLINGLAEFEEIIRDNIKSGGTDFAKPTKIKSFDAYANKYSLDAFRGVTLWNAVYPESRIEESSTALIFSAIPGSDYELFLKLMEKSNDPNKEGIIDIVTSLFFNPDDEPEMVKNGLNWVAIPFSVESVPEWMIPLIDADEIVSKNTAPVLPILESVDIKVAGGNKYTNIVKF